MSRYLSVVLVGLALAGAAGCGDSGDDGGSPPPRTAEQDARPVTDEQALVLARLLQQNRQRGGATITGEVDISGVTMPMRGRVDFRSGRGTATLKEPAAASRRYVWTRRAVYAQAAPESKRYEVQPADPDNDPVHSAIAFINALSAETIDNTTNIKDQGVRFVGRETLGGTPVDAFDYGADGRTRYWVDRDDGLLRQVQATFGDQGTLMVRLGTRAPQRISLPGARRAR
jgi:hypothetical protein